MLRAHYNRVHKQPEETVETVELPLVPTPPPLVKYEPLRVPLRPAER